MHIITTKTHGLLDYPFGFLLFASPWIFGFADGGPQMIIPVTLGAIIPIMSLMTRYEGGLIRVIPMRVHIAIDVVAGIFLAASPWLFHFNDAVYEPHLGFGIFQVVTSLLTDSRPTNYHNPRRVMP
jgi:hypothetical protein